MSEKDRFDWSDENSFESLADEPIEGFADLDEIADLDDMVDYGDTSDEELAAAEPQATDAKETVSTTEEDEKKPVPSVSGRSSRGISSGELGALFTASILVAAAGVGSASLLVVGVNPASLWQPEKLLAWENYLNLSNNPLNILMLICLGIVALTLLGSYAIAKAANGANNRTRAAEQMLDQVTALRLENEGAWQSTAFSDYGPAAAFVAETLGAWRLQAARQKHFTGLEGELQRLEKALSSNSRVDLTGRFDSPAVGALSDEMIRYFDEREALARAVSELQEKDQATAAEIVQVLQDARCWHEASGQNLGLQGAAMDRFAERLNELHAEWAQDLSQNEVRTALTDFLAEFDHMGTSKAAAPSPTAELTELVDRGSKLAFQIAMEVARLGPRGERLVPMSQSLEDLTTDFRKVTNQFESSADSGQEWTEDLAKLKAKLTPLVTAVRDSGEEDWQQQLQLFVPAAGQMASNIADVVQSYVPQAERLTGLGTSFSEFSGAEFDGDDLSSGNPENPPAGVLSIDDRAPFADDESVHNQDGIHQPADVDPFAVTPPKVLDSPADPSFTSSVGRDKADIFGSGMQSTELPALELETSLGIEHDPFGKSEADSVNPELSDNGEKVYDLEDFGAVSAAVPDSTPVVKEVGPVVADENESGVYELSDFAAQPLADEEKVHDLAEFGGVRLDDPQAEPDEEVFDLNAFGAVPLT